MAQGGPWSGEAASSSSSFTTSSYSHGEVNEEYLRNLMDMGIHREDARQALRMVNNRSLEDALAVVFGETPTFSTASGTSTSGAPIEQATQVSYESNVIPTDNDTTDANMMSYKMLFIVNGSLAMSSGKMAAQVAHCAIDLHQEILNRRMQALNFWMISGRRKIVLRGDSPEELLDIQQRISMNKSVVSALIQDAGRTEIARGSITCLGLFGTDSQLDSTTGHLRLLTDCLKCSGTNKSRKSKKDSELPPTTTDDLSNSP